MNRKWRTNGVEGRTQGLREGRLERQRIDLMKILQTGLQVSLPADLMSAVNTQTDQAALDHWIDTALTTPSLEEYRPR